MAVVARRRQSAPIASPTAPQFFALRPLDKFATFRAHFPREADAMLTMMDLIWETRNTGRIQAKAADKRAK